jgi:citrate synthase
LPVSKEKCTVTMPGGEAHEISLYEPVLGPKALDGAELSKKTGMFTYDPGFTSTASCVS